MIIYNKNGKNLNIYTAWKFAKWTPGYVYIYFFHYSAVIG